jgi:hypothetical protein
MIARRRFTRDRQGRYHPHLQLAERELLESLPRQAQQLLVEDDPAAFRLFPPAYADDPAAEAEYSALMAESLRTRHQEVLDTLASTVGADSIDEEQLQQWMAAVEVLRLVLGTQLDVQEDMRDIDPEDPDAPRYAVYAYLSMLQDEIVDALASTLPDAGNEAL